VFVFIKTLLVTLVKSVLTWIYRTASLGAMKAFYIFIVLWGLGLFGLLPRSPFHALNAAIMSEHAQASSLLRYIPVFIPIPEMLGFLSIWSIVVMVWYGYKVLIKPTGVI